MKREFLQEFRVGDEPLPKEVIDAIMAENGRDIQKVRAGFADYEELKQTLARQEQDWQEKLRQTVLTHRQELADIAFQKDMGEAIARAGGRNAKAIAVLLDEEALKSSENHQDALDAALAALKKDCRYLFQEDTPPPYARGTGAFQAPWETHPATLAGALQEKFERK